MIAFPKPKDMKRRPMPAYRILPGGREVCAKTPAGLREYRARTLVAWRRDFGICGWCIRPVSSDEVTADHIRIRGSGGGWRDDRIENLRGLHGPCNSERGSSRFLTRKEWLEAKGRKP
jgi:5-methylcytosine-specific restriction endonuclease McrA